MLDYNEKSRKIDYDLIDVFEKKNIDCNMS